MASLFHRTVYFAIFKLLSDVERIKMYFFLKQAFNILQFKTILSSMVIIPSSLSVGYNNPTDRNDGVVLLT